MALSTRAGYFIVVTILFARGLGAVPANDEPENAITVPMPLPQTVQVDTTTATSNPADPAVGCTGGATVWYRITPDFSGILVIDAAAFSANVSVYDGVLS